jgi:exodeoxyribonuclease-1
MSSETFLWYDLETFGLNARYDRIAQFAAVRTDMNLNVIEEPHLFYCKLSDDYLPDPLSVLVTGITPQLANEKGLRENEFIGKINELMSVPKTCSVGFNTLRFDDEFIRFSLFRNFHDPYLREYDKGNSRWDILDLARAAYDLRPDGLNWPAKKENGMPSFKLVDLAAANNIENKAAHDALNDVWVTIEVARLIQQKQPKLFSYYLKLRNKNFAKSLFSTPFGEPFVLTAAQFTRSQGCSTVVVPITYSATNPNSLIVFDLTQDPTPLINAARAFEELSVINSNEKNFKAALQIVTKALDEKTNYIEALKVAKTQLGEATSIMARLPQLISAHDQLLRIKGLHQVALNRAPFISPLSIVTPELEKSLNIDLQNCFKNLEILKNEAMLPVTLMQAYEKEEYTIINDVDFTLYSGPFFNNADNKLFEQIRSKDAKELWQTKFEFDDKRAHEMLWRYLCRNYSSSLDETQAKRWKSFCAQRLIQPPVNTIVTLQFYARKIEERLNSRETEPKEKELLVKLAEYGQEVANRVGLSYPST